MDIERKVEKIARQKSNENSFAKTATDFNRQQQVQSDRNKGVERN